MQKIICGRSQILLILLLLLLCLSIIIVHAQPGPHHEGGESNEPEDILLESESEEDIKMVKDMCMDLREVHLPYLQHRNQLQPETRIIKNAMQLGQNLVNEESKKRQDRKAAKKSKKLGYEKLLLYTCEDAARLLTHSTAAEFHDFFDKYINGDFEDEVVHSSSTSPGAAASQKKQKKAHSPNHITLTYHIRKLQTVLSDGGLINEDVKTMLDSIRSVLTHLQIIHEGISALYQQILSYPHLQGEKLYHPTEGTAREQIGKTDEETQKISEDERICVKTFHEYEKKLNEIGGEHIPQWYELHRGVEMLLQQCEEDKLIERIEL